MQITCKAFEDQFGRTRKIVKVEVEDGEELTPEQAIVMLLNQIDDRLYDIGHSVSMIS